MASAENRPRRIGCVLGSRAPSRTCIVRRCVMKICPSQALTSSGCTARDHKNRKAHLTGSWVRRRLGHTWSKARWCLPIFAAPAASVVVRTRFVQSRLSRGRRSARVRHRKNRQPLSRLAPGAPGLGEPARAARQGRRGAGDEIVRPSPPREAAVTRFPVLTLRTRSFPCCEGLGAHPGVPADCPDHMGHASELIPRSSAPDFGFCEGAALRYAATHASGRAQFVVRSWAPSPIRKNPLQQYHSV